MNNVSEDYSGCILELTQRQVSNTLSDIFVRYQDYLENVTEHSWSWFLDQFEAYYAEHYDAQYALDRLGCDICTEIIESDPENMYCDARLNEILDKYSDMLVEYCISVEDIADFLDSLCELMEMRDALDILETKFRKINAFGESVMKS